MGYRYKRPCWIMSFLPIKPKLEQKQSQIYSIKSIISYKHYIHSIAHFLHVTNCHVILDSKTVMWNFASEPAIITTIITQIISDNSTRPTLKASKKYLFRDKPYKIERALITRRQCDLEWPWVRSCVATDHCEQLNNWLSLCTHTTPIHTPYTAVVRLHNITFIRTVTYSLWLTTCYV